MKFCATADTDVGISKKTNQDSVLIKHAKADGKEVLLAVVCDGMGGLSRGELASATVVRAFSQWFDNNLSMINSVDTATIGKHWTSLLVELNSKISAYSEKIKSDGMGTTFTGLLFIDNEYLIVHVGDTRAYFIDDSLLQLTSDQTFIAREIQRGTMTVEEAKTDKRRNMLLQCVGASKTVDPEILTGEVKKGTYMLCSDGFRHEVSEEEFINNFSIDKLFDKESMHRTAKELIELSKSRNEKDNISVVLVKAE